MRGEAEQLAFDGMMRAVEHADVAVENWRERATAKLRYYARLNREFMTEQVRTWAHDDGLPLPPDPRAWGAVINSAVRQNVLVRDRFEHTKIPPAHATPRPVWRSLLYGGR